ncbi:MAG TPA: DUF2752 domain-containing protein [Ktedonobacterales bacterium]|nr:DUF2752 domain-containing protein [Ktedonobacterales bacterium]
MRKHEPLMTLGKLAFLLALPLLLILVPTAWLERRRSLCVIKNLTGRNCPGCGMTRAISSASHGEFRQAWRYNKLVVIVLPILGYEWLQALAKASRRYRLLSR